MHISAARRYSRHRYPCRHPYGDVDAVASHGIEGVEKAWRIAAEKWSREGIVDLKREKSVMPMLLCSRRVFVAIRVDVVVQGDLIVSWSSVPGR